MGAVYNRVGAQLPCRSAALRRDCFGDSIAAGRIRPGLPVQEARPAGKGLEAVPGRLMIYEHLLQRIDMHRPNWQKGEARLHSGQ